MKYFIVILSFILLTVDTLPQNMRRGGMQSQKKINQLEKVKLLEVLELDDETAVKFFRLKDQHEEDMMSLRDKQDKILDIMEETLSEDESKKTSSLSKLITDYKKNEMEMTDERDRFHKEIWNVLQPEKYARFLVFERNFRQEVRNLIMGNRMRRRANP